MKKSASIFVISMIVATASGVARADVASAGYVDEKVAANTAAIATLNGDEKTAGSVAAAVANAKSALTTEISKKANSADLAKVATSGAYADLSGRPTVDAALSSTSTNAVQNQAVNTALENKQDKSTAVTHTAGAAAGDATHPVYVTTAGVATKIDKVAAAAAADSATKASQDAKGNTIDTTYATKTELSTGLGGKQDKLTETNIKGSGSVSVSVAADGVVTVSGTDTKYTLPNANGTTLGGVKTGGDLTATAGELTITDGKVTTAKINNGAVTADKLGANAVTTAKINNGAVTFEKLNTNAVLGGAYDSSKLSDTDRTNKVPTVGLAENMALGAAASVIDSTVQPLIQSLDSSSSGAGPVVTEVSQTDGKVTVTKGNVKIPVGSETATSYATIWVE